MRAVHLWDGRTTAVFQALQPGDHVLVSRVLYYGVRQCTGREFAVPWGLDVEFIDTTDLDAVAAAILPGPHPAAVDRDAARNPQPGTSPTLAVACQFGPRGRGADG